MYLLWDTVITVRDGRESDFVVEEQIDKWDVWDVHIINDSIIRVNNNK